MSADRDATTATDGSGPTAAQHAMAQLEELVQQLEPGTSLPSEPQLAATLGVSRVTIREVVKALQARGIIDVHHGRRAVVAHLHAGPMGDFFTMAVRRDPRRLLDLLEVRLAIEVHVAALAAKNSGRAALTALEHAVRALEEADGDLGAVNKADLDFHEALADASGNQMLSVLLEALEVPLGDSRLVSARGHLAQGGRLQDVVAEHAGILQLVRARDADGAAAAMRQHLEATGRDLRAGFHLTLS